MFEGPIQGGQGTLHVSRFDEENEILDVEFDYTVNVLNGPTRSVVGSARIRCFDNVVLGEQ